MQFVCKNSDKSKVRVSVRFGVICQVVCGGDGVLSWSVLNAVHCMTETCLVVVVVVVLIFSLNATRDIDNFATVNRRKACDIEKVLEFHVEKKLNLHVGAHKYLSNLHKCSVHMI